MRTGAPPKTPYLAPQGPSPYSSTSAGVYGACHLRTLLCNNGLRNGPFVFLVFFFVFFFERMSRILPNGPDRLFHTWRLAFVSGLAVEPCLIDAAVVMTQNRLASRVRHPSSTVAESSRIRKWSLAFHDYYLPR
ncbi:hypothetical protein GGR50DRAFT_283999 [Xylaria sp. CBS 124048]|nr:hypothetical protein GGR50DRAFT_283999 [Xylaria sp. CBS 124048]